MSRRIGVFGTAALFLATSLAASADSMAYSSAPQTTGEPPSGAAMMGDLVLVRPLGLVATAVGGLVFLLDVPFMAFQSGGPSGPYQRLVAEPAHFTFVRPLGASD